MKIRNSCFASGLQVDVEEARGHWNYGILLTGGNKLRGE